MSGSLATFLGHVPEEKLDFGWTPSDSARSWRRTIASLPANEFFDVAEVGDRVVGFVWAGSNTEKEDVVGTVRGLYVAPTRQGRGIGRALLRHAAARLVAAGATSLLIGCVRENPSCGFYRHLGGVEAYRRPQTVDRFETEEIFFSWTDLTPLLK